MNQPSCLVVAVAVMLAGFASSAGAASAARLSPLPAPTGPYAVGRKSFDWIDESRSDTESPDGHRELVVWVWYPASPVAGARPAALFPGQWGDLYRSSFAKLVPGSVAEEKKHSIHTITSHAYPDAPVRSGSEAYPVVVFVPGGGDGPLEYAAIIEDLVSHGYIVAGIVPTHYSGSSVFSDGRVPTERSFSEGPTALIAALPVIVGDIGFTLDRLAQLNADANSSFRRRLAADHAGVLGHSLGGAASLEASKEDTRLKAVIDIDGTRLDDVVTGPAKPVLMMNSDMSNMMLGNPYAAMLSSAKPGYRMVLAGSTHAFCMDISVLPLLPPDARRAQNLPSIPNGGKPPDGKLESMPAVGAVLRRPGVPDNGVKVKAPIVGSIDPARALAITAAYIDAFFGEYLKGQSTSLLQGPSPDYPEVSFEKAQAGSG
jgi:dienelactone hydrolase